VQLAEPPHSRFDLNFKLGSIPVRVHPMFWVVGLILGFVSFKHPVGASIWLLALFISILVHELGHAMTAKHYGWPPSIVLYGMGGLALYTPTHRKRGPRTLISFMGPGAGFIKGGIILAIILATGHGVTLPVIDIRIGGPEDLFTGRLGLFVYCMLFIDFFWGLLNLAPIQPLDGGAITANIVEKYRPRNALALTLQISIVASGVLAFVGMFAWQSVFIAIMFGALGFESWQLLQRAKANGWA
jgi:membrane-associated protease RseP (regulator of RpoE activity)